MLGAAVPEATIDEHCKTGTSEDNIRVAMQFQPGSKAEPFGEKFPA